MLLGYNTNGFAHHHPEAAMRLLADIGYRSVGLTIDHGVLNPHDASSIEQSARLRRLAKKLGLTLMVETGARYLLDPRTKHEPTLVSSNRQQRGARIAFYEQAIEIARELGANGISLWSGVVHDGASRDEAYDRLVAGLAEVLKTAARTGTPVAFEPEPGMLVATLADYDELKLRLASANASLEALRLTVDIGHLHCNGETPIADRLIPYAEELVNVHIEDMRAGVHEHLMFGEGEIDFPPIIDCLKRIGYQGPLQVELSRHSHEAPAAAQRSFDFLTPLLS